MTKDIEREAFEDWYCKHHTGLKQSDLYKFRTLSGYSFSDSLKINISWEAWQAAKAHEAKKLEGCVVVPVEMPDSFNDATTDYFNDISEGENYDAFVKLVDIDNKSIWAMAVEAARGGNE